MKIIFAKKISDTEYEPIQCCDVVLNKQGRKLLLDKKSKTGYNVKKTDCTNGDYEFISVEKK